MADARKQFLNWLAKTRPDFMRAVIRAAKRNGAIEPFGFGQDEETEEDKAWWETLIDTAGQLATQYYQVQSQRDIIKMNAERAKQGLPPIDTSDVAPRVGVDVAIDWEQLKVPLLIGGGLLAFALLKR